MKRLNRLFSISALVLLAACGREVASTQSDAPPSTAATDTMAITSVSDSAANAADLSNGVTVMSARVNPKGSVIKVEFHGAISHITGQNPTRAAVIKDANHISKLTIMRPTQIGSNQANSESALQTAVGDPTKNKATCGAGFCEVTPLDGLVIRVVDDTGTLLSGPLTLGPDFELFVPALKTVGKVITPDKNLSLPAPIGDFAAFFELTGGALSAKSYCLPVSFDKDHEGRNPRDFAETVTLTASTDTPAGLQFSTDGINWRTLKFFRSTSLMIRIANDPDSDHQNMAHFDLHKKVADDENKVVDYPTLPNTLDNCNAGLAVGCGNTRWP
jgi:hypothetical protein